MGTTKKYSTKKFVLSLVAIILIYVFAMSLLLAAFGILFTVMVGGAVFLIVKSGNNGTLQLSYEDCPGGLLVTGTTVFETKRIVIPSEVDGVPVIGIQAGAFENNEKLTEIVLPDTLRTVEARAFSGCTSLKEIVFPSSMEYIGDEAFFGCVSLERVTFGENTRFIGHNAFSECVALTEISELNAEEIGMQAFYACEKLESVTIGESVGKIGMASFYGCSALNSLEIKGGDFVIGGEYVVTREELSMMSHMITMLTDTYSQYDWLRR